MNFKSWVGAERGRAIRVARAIDVPASFVSKMASGEKAIPAEHCKTIESLSGGEVTCPEMRPRDWHKYWPELATPHHTDAPADQTARQAHPIEHRSQSARRTETAPSQQPTAQGVSHV